MAKKIKPNPCYTCESGSLAVKKEPFGNEIHYYVQCNHCESSGPDAIDKNSAIKAWNEDTVRDHT